MVFPLFRLPGEAMQIDRVMDAFAAHYCAQNPYLFQGMDITFTIQYCTVYAAYFKRVDEI